jgi:hypothetical protein
MTMTDIIKIAAIAVLPLLLAGYYAQAAEPTVITLSCDGTVKINVGKNEGQLESINKVGVVVDLAKHTVAFAGNVAHIDSVDAAVISFGGDALQGDPQLRATGDIDRVTGMMSAATVNGIIVTSYNLLCKPTTRLF